MAAVMFPIRPRLKHYRGTKENLRRKAAEENKIAEKIAKHLNTLIANNDEEMQQYIYGYIAIDLRVTAEQVRRALPGGGSYGITLRVTEENRRALRSYKTRVP